MAQEQKSGSAAAQKGPPAGAASAAPAKASHTTSAMPPPLPSASANSEASKSEASDGDSLADSLAQVLPASSVVNLGSAAASGKHKVPPPLPNMASRAQAAPLSSSERPAEPPFASEPVRRMARRRPAGPPRQKIAANDDAPSIGGLIYALEQKPSTTPFKYAAMASAGWIAICLIFGWIIVSAEFAAGATLATLLAKPSTFLTITAIIVPVAVLWALALLAWRADDLRLRASTMT